MKLDLGRLILLGRPLQDSLWVSLWALLGDPLQEVPLRDAPWDLLLFSMPSSLEGPLRDSLRGPLCDLLWSPQERASDEA